MTGTLAIKGKDKEVKLTAESKNAKGALEKIKVGDVKKGKPFQMRPGAYASLPSRHVHQATCSSACVLFNTADGIFDIHYVDQSGTEIPADQALKKKAASGAAKTK